MLTLSSNHPKTLRCTTSSIWTAVWCHVAWNVGLQLGTNLPNLLPRVLSNCSALAWWDPCTYKMVVRVKKLSCRTVEWDSQTYRIVFSRPIGTTPGGGTTISLTMIRAPFLSAGTRDCKILIQYLSDQSWKTQRKKYTSAPLTDCSLKKSCTMNLTRSISSAGSLALASATVSGRSCTMQCTPGQCWAKAIPNLPCEPPMSTKVLMPISLQGKASRRKLGPKPSPLLIMLIVSAKRLERSGNLLNSVNIVSLVLLAMENPWRTSISEIWPTRFLVIQYDSALVTLAILPLHRQPYETTLSARRSICHEHCLTYSSCRRPHLITDPSNVWSQHWSLCKKLWHSCVSHKPFASFLEDVLCHGEAQNPFQVWLYQIASLWYLLIRCLLVDRETGGNIKTIDALESKEMIMLPRASWLEHRILVGTRMLTSRMCCCT